MSDNPVVARRASWLRRISQRQRRLIACAAAIILVVGAFLQWGPIGLGSGPLALNMGAGLQGSTEQRQGPVGFTIPLYNSSHSHAVIDELRLVGGTKYAGPRLLHLAVLSTPLCGGAWPAHSSGDGFRMGCGGHYVGPLIGRAVGFTFTRPVPAGFPGAAEVAGPPPGGCWVMTEVVIHYHVGIRHYTATDPYELAVCGKDASAQTANAANAAAAVGG
jgi:hypothetical protein